MNLKSIYKTIVLSALALFLYGCGSSGINLRTYAEDRPRVDQEISGMGNAGYIGEACNRAPSRNAKRRARFM